MYQVEVTTVVRKEIRELPGNMRQRILRLLKELREEPRPNSSQWLDIAKLGIELESSIGLYRIRIESWRVVYVALGRITVIDCSGNSQATSLPI